ncbi:hypothetical protein AJ80_01690 [Polytolypa hystricis UAMH7299]|uniref:Rhodopsin domain-containing protein n=1 Tax=Polytolypa hystricis (strain UAMH7299) TaxID=1447883 RepID=A0A2B7YZS2_POLH7|nr:hypothetical protein AJ80_01690 [Polytolypa hystricis UAMH7299]
MDPECSQTVWTTPFLLDPNCDRGPDKSLQYSRWLVVEVTGVAVEIFLVWLPIYLTWGLQMPLKSKLLVISAFSFRLPVIIISGVRTYYLHRDISSDDILFSTADSSVWMEISLHYGLIAATIPCLKPFIKAFNTGYLSQRGGSSEYGMHDPNSYVLSNISVGSESRGRDRMLFSRANNNRSKTPITLDIQGHHRDQGSNSPSAERRYRTYHINPTTKGFDHSVFLLTQRSKTEHTVKMLITRGFSLTNFVIASSALAFQVFVLYPWHEQLQEDFEELKKEHLRVTKEADTNRAKDLKEIKGQLSTILSKKGWP